MIMEFRTYTMRPGAREEFVRYFEAEAIPRMRAAGMTVVGQFSSVTDANVFAYARTFDSVEQREAQYNVFYESEDWLGWMIDTAMGKEESFLVFLGDSDGPTQPPAAGLSGVHSDRFTLASSRGVVAAVSGDNGKASASAKDSTSAPQDGTPDRTQATITVDDEDGTSVTFGLPADARVFHTPNGRGMTPAVPIAAGDLQPGDRVLVLGAQTEAGPSARQIVKRPNG
ncbi:MAG: hypothetical protein QOE61_5183 [Micromonosporaceae bacterium]|nr:hypothetical protein [Micromonosporaceae bacterium]